MRVGNRVRRWEAKRRAHGGCISCCEPALPGRVRCEGCLQKRRRWNRAQYQPVTRPITREDVVRDLQAVAARLKVRIVTTNLYRQEGSYCLSDAVRRQIGPWSAFCVEAGLLPTYRGCRGIDRTPCARCQRVRVVHGRHTPWCYECKRTMRRRKTEYGRQDVVA